MGVLDGAVVAIVARYSDDPELLARPLIDSGATVLVCADWSPHFDPPDDEQLIEMVRPSVERPERAVFLTAIDGAVPFDLADDHAGGARIVRWIRRAFGRLDAVIIGFETGLAGALGEPLARRLRRTGGEVIVLEGRSSTADEWARRFGLESVPGRPTVVRWTTSARRRASTAGLAPVLATLVGAGVVVRPTRAGMRRAHEVRRRSGDPLSGLAWEAIGSGDHDHGGCAFLTARSLEANTSVDPTDIPWSPNAVTLLDDFGLDGLIVSDHNGMALIEAASDGDAVVAVRVGTLTDSFDHDGSYDSVGDWRPATTDAPIELVVGDPWLVIADHGGWPVTLAPATVWHVEHSVLDREMVGTRMWCDRAIALAKRTWR